MVFCLSFIFLLIVFFFFFFFFSSRRRHTRLVSDWSSDVCSSDLNPREAGPHGFLGHLVPTLPGNGGPAVVQDGRGGAGGQVRLSEGRRRSPSGDRPEISR